MKIKIYTGLFLVVNAAMLVSAESTGYFALSSSYWMVTCVVLVLMTSLTLTQKVEPPLEVQGLIYDEDKHKLELTIRNTTKEMYNLKSALRLIQLVINAPNEDNGIKQYTVDGLLPMLSGSYRVFRSDMLYDLLSEDDEMIVINPEETKRLYYDVLLPKDYLQLEPNDYVDVSVYYGTDDLSNLVSREVSLVFKEKGGEDQSGTG